MSQMRKDVHMTGKDLMEMVQLRAEDVGRYAIVPGPKDRMEAVVKKLEQPVKNFSFMEYTMYTGFFDGIKVTTINGGRFSADTAITTEILCNAQVGYLLRIGSCGALREDIQVGDLVVVSTALRGEGVTQYYVEKDFVPTADKSLTDEFIKAAEDASCKVHVGSCWTTDAILKETREFVGRAVDDGAIAVDMVTAAFLTIAQTYNIPAAVMLAVSDNVITGEMGFMNPNYYMAETAMINIAFNVIKGLNQSN